MLEGAPGGGNGAGGTLVERTGLVVVDRGERIVAAVESRAVLAPAAVSSARETLELVFPVEIEIRGGAQELDLDQVADLVLERLTRGMLGA